MKENILQLGTQAEKGVLTCHQTRIMKISNQIDGKSQNRFTLSETIDEIGSERIKAIDLDHISYLIEGNIGKMPDISNQLFKFATPLGLRGYSKSL